ncbi:MAG: hypothetical protein Q7U02_02365, partial [Desulfosalsimonadaceae bacterium]|nr:hypothetical protein [Desulfosalsimonadaceae bacterium]
QNVAAASFGLTIASSSGGAVTVPGEGKFTYNAGTVVNLTATPDAGYAFIIWTGDVADFKSPATTVTMNGNKSVSANFAPRIIYVADIAMSLVSASGGKSARAIVSVRDNQGNPVSGVTVKGVWSGLVSGSVTGTTGTKGTAAFTSKKTKRKGTITFAVTRISAPGYAYDPARNVEIRDAISTRTVPGTALRSEAGASLAPSAENAYPEMFRDEDGSNGFGIVLSSCELPATSGGDQVCP